MGSHGLSGTEGDDRGESPPAFSRAHTDTRAERTLAGRCALGGSRCTTVDRRGRPDPGRAVGGGGGGGGGRDEGGCLETRSGSRSARRPASPAVRGAAGTRAHMRNNQYWLHRRTYGNSGIPNTKHRLTGICIHPELGELAAAPGAHRLNTTGVFHLPSVD